MAALEEELFDFADDHDSFQVLMIRLNEMLVCLDVHNVLRCLSLVALQTLPGGAPYVIGIMNFAGASVPVVDLALRLGLPSSPYTINTPIIICTSQNLNIGLIAADILGIQNQPSSKLQLIHELGSPHIAFRASLHTEQGMALLLNADWLVQSELYQIEAQTEALMP